MHTIQIFVWQPHVIQLLHLATATTALLKTKDFKTILLNHQIYILTTSLQE